MRRFLHLAVRSVVLIALAGAAGDARAAWNDNRALAADKTLSAIVTSATPSVSACVAIDGVAVYAKGFGTIAPGVPATAQTIYRIGSLTKQFVAAGVLALIEDGATVPADGSKFGLQTNVSSFFTGVGQWSAGGAPMTVQRLLTMTSNLPTYTSQAQLPNLDPTKPVQTSVLLQAITGFQAASPPPVFNYSNTNYFLLAAIIDKITSANFRLGAKFGNGPADEVIAVPDYRGYLRKRIFARAGLSATNFIDDAAPLGTMAPPTYASPAQWSNMSWPRGAGAIQSNAADLCKWDSALMKNQVIGAASVAIMGTSGTPLSGAPGAPGAPFNGYAMGWYVNKFQTYLEYYHNGNIAGYTAENVIDLFGGGGHVVSVSILTNGDYTPGLYLAATKIAASARQPPDILLQRNTNQN